MKWWGVVSAALVIAACASTRPSASAIAVDRASIEAARSAGAPAGRQQSPRVEIVFSDSHGRFASR